MRTMKNQERHNRVTLSLKTSALLSLGLHIVLALSLPFFFSNSQTHAPRITVVPVALHPKSAEKNPIPKTAHQTTMTNRTPKEEPKKPPLRIGDPGSPPRLLSERPLFEPASRKEPIEPPKPLPVAKKEEKPLEPLAPAIEPPKPLPVAKSEEKSPEPLAPAIEPPKPLAVAKNEEKSPEPLANKAGPSTQAPVPLPREQHHPVSFGNLPPKLDNLPLPSASPPPSPTGAGVAVVASLRGNGDGPGPGERGGGGHGGLRGKGNGDGPGSGQGGSGQEGSGQGGLSWKVYGEGHRGNLGGNGRGDSGDGLGKGGGSGSGTRSGSGIGSSSGTGSGSGSGSGTGTGFSSGRGTGLWGKLFSSPGGGGASQPRYAENPKPPYPSEARDRGYQGEVLLTVEVLANGKVGQIEVKKSSGYEILDHSALSTVKQWRFVPAKKGEETISMWVNIPIKFKLQ